MRKYGFLLGMCIDLLVYANQEIDLPQQEIIMVSLGSHCQSSIILRRLGLRQCAMPLDWLLSFDHKGLIRLIDDDFQHMLDADHLTQYPEGYVVNRLYNLEFRHDWHKHNLLQELPDILSKYRRRIHRFFQLPAIAKRVVFIRTIFDPKLNVSNNMPTYTPASTFIDVHQARELHACLKNKFPDLKFVLAIINFANTSSGIPDDAHGIVEFKVKHLVKDADQFLYLLGDPNYFDRLYTHNHVEKHHNKHQNFHANSI
ncbi:MAG: hypothetical protein KDK50_03530 [Chlamydiia bacterium]|nr:hypothetical protein [Chlamydiia bacterium]